MKLSKYLSWLYDLNKWIRFLIILIIIFIIAYADYITPAEFSARIFYLIPLFLAVWNESGISAGIYFSIICTIVYYYTELLQGNIHWHGASLVWEFLINGGYYVVFVITVEKIKNITLLLSRKNEELKKANDQKDKLFSIIAHDLRSPFQGFLGITQSLAENADSYTGEELSNLFVKMHQTADNLFSLLKNLLEWTQMQKGSMSFQPKEFSLTDLITENILALERRSEQKGIKLINNVPKNVNAFGDEKMIGSVILNLISNAIKFTNREGKVTISLQNRADNNIIEISVNDTGTGMPASTVENLFKVGEKVRSVGTDGELSTGLGLLLCKEFVEKHNGKIWAVSELNTGSTFSFTLPSNNKQ
ncbi:MAG: ATP-binding protein [Ignavibacteriaceae bacterium]|nr:ATP-binding protein [Ignavibacteriaceae bacterium]